VYRQIWSVKFDLWYLGYKLKFASEFKYVFRLDREWILGGHVIKSGMFVI